MIMDVVMAPRLRSSEIEGLPRILVDTVEQWTVVDDVTYVYGIDDAMIRTYVGVGDNGNKINIKVDCEHNMFVSRADIPRKTTNYSTIQMIKEVNEKKTRGTKRPAPNDSDDKTVQNQVKITMDELKNKSLANIDKLDVQKIIESVKDSLKLNGSAIDSKIVGGLIRKYVDIYMFDLKSVWSPKPTKVGKVYLKIVKSTESNDTTDC